MTIRRKWALAAATFTVATVTLILVWSGPAEPSCAGRTLSEWLLSFTPHLNQPPPPAAAEAVRHIGTNAIPYLLRWIADRDTPTPKERAAQWAKAHLPHALAPHVLTNWDNPMPRFARAIAGSKGLLALGPAAAPAIPELEKIATTPSDIRDILAIDVLASLGPPARAALERIAAQRTNACASAYAAPWLAKLTPQSGPIKASITRGISATGH